LVLDEPTANLDPRGTAAVYARLAALKANRATTIVLVEHRVEVAWALADIVLALGADGRPIDVGPAAEVLQRSRARLDEAGVWLPDGIRRRRRARRTNVGDAAVAAVPALPALQVGEAWF